MQKRSSGEQARTHRCSGDRETQKLDRREKRITLGTSIGW